MRRGPAGAPELRNAAETAAAWVSLWHNVHTVLSMSLRLMQRRNGARGCGVDLCGRRRAPLPCALPLQGQSQRGGCSADAASGDDGSGAWAAAYADDLEEAVRAASMSSGRGLPRAPVTRTERRLAAVFQSAASRWKAPQMDAATAAPMKLVQAAVTRDLAGGAAVPIGQGGFRGGSSVAVVCCWSAPD